MSYLIFTSFVVIGNLINIIFKKKTLKNVLVGLFLVWPIFFSFFSFFYRNFEIVAGVYSLLLFSGIYYLFRLKNFKHVFLVSIFAIALLLLSRAVSQFSVDLDSKNYLLLMSRLNFESWGQICDKKLGIVGLAEHGYYQRLPYIGYGWVHNIFSVSLNPSTAYIHSLFFYLSAVTFLSGVFMKYFKVEAKRFSIFSWRIISVIFSIGLIGPYMFYSASWGQMNQSFTLLLTAITIYIFNSDMENKSRFILISIISPLILLSYPEFYFFWIVLFLILVFSDKEYFSRKGLIILLSPLSSMFFLLPNFAKYYNYVSDIANLGLVVNMIENPQPKFSLIYYFFQFFSGRDLFGFIDAFSVEVRNVVANLFPMVLFGILANFILEKLKQFKKGAMIMSTLIGIVIYLFIYAFLIYRKVGLNYVIFKYSGWTSWIVLFLWFKLSLTKFTNNVISKILLFILLLLVTARICNLISLYFQARINVSHQIINPVYLEKTQKNGKCQVKFNKDYISTVVTLGNYLVEKNNCDCEVEKK